METTLAPTPVAQHFLPELDHELLLTRRVLERLPAEQFGWQPHPKSMPLGKLASHVADLLSLVPTAFQTDELDLTNYADMVDPEATTPAELLQRLEQHAATTRATLATATTEDFAQLWTLRYGDFIILQQPRTGIVRHLISHLIHHRSQLSVYLRLLDAPVPAIYGPSADDPNMVVAGF